MRNEQGFFLLETIVLGMILLAAVEVLGLYYSIEYMRRDSAAETTALFLAQEQCARVAAVQNSAEILPEGPLAWLGKTPCPIVKNGYSFQVESTLSKNTSSLNLQNLETRVIWSEGSKNKQIMIQRVIKCYEK